MFIIKAMFLFLFNQINNHTMRTYNIPIPPHKIEINIDIFFTNHLILTMPCLAIDRHKLPCRVSPVCDTRFCKFHQYMSVYTPEMLSSLELCSGCKKAYHFDTETKTCDACKTRSKQNRADIREQVVLCSKNDCKYKRSEENKYCKKHQIELFIDETEAENKKKCFNYVRGCRTKLEQSYMFSKCQDCLTIDREKDKARRGGVKEQNVVVVVGETTEKGCTVCCKILPIEEFRGIRREITATCRSCRDDNKVQDMRRDREHRNEIARVNEAKPERVEVKKQWREDNYEKVAEYWMNSRQHKIEEIGVEEYLKNNAEQAKNWRENNPEKVKQNNENKINSIELQYGVYKRSADLKQLDFIITFEEYAEIVKNPCHYCGVLHNRGFNGIDRENNKKGYILENCVSCCKMCNYMKKSLSGDVFVNRAEHILTYNNFISGKTYPELFADHNTYYCDYKNRALKKQLDFRLIPTDYDNITKQPCYICGKENTKTHKNGIDRYDNDINVGYILENCRPCCGECNYMKRDYYYDDMFDKLKMIYEYNNTKETSDEGENNIENPVENITFTVEDLDELDNDTILSNNNENTKITNETELIHLNSHINIEPKNRSIVRGNKKTIEQVREEAKVKKQKQREELKARYGDEEYKKMNAKKVAEYRAKKNNK